MSGTWNVSRRQLMTGLCGAAGASMFPAKAFDHARAAYEAIADESEAP